jgi:hypothetical protein
MNYNTNVSLHKPPATSFARATAISRSVDELFFQKYISILNRHNFGPSQMYNVNETGLPRKENPHSHCYKKGLADGQCNIW